MKLLIASDIHGCASAARLLVDHFKKEKADQILLLGDLLYHGPRNALPGEYDTQKTAEILNELKDQILCVRGNCDAEVDQCLLDFPIFEEFRQIEVEGNVIFATHGHHNGPDNPPPIGSGNILMCGHTHIPCHYMVADMLYCNPGSTSIPKGGSKPSFLVFDGKALVWKELLTGSIFDTQEV